jgi:uncharacterized protein
MNCPKDNVEMVKTTREGIEIDYCPTCRGVWLDRGELSKIVERSATEWESFSKGKEKSPDYPDLTKMRDKPNYDAPGAFFGRIFHF